MKGYGSVWYYHDGIANMCNVEKKHKVTYDSSMKTGFIMHKADGNNCIFMPSKRVCISLMLKMTQHMS